LVQLPKGLNIKLEEQILAFCKHVAGSYKITAAFICGDYALGSPNPKVAVEVLLVIRDFQRRLMNYLKVFDERTVVLFAVDEWVFERDVDRGFLGEALAGGLIFSYMPMINEDYLHLQEVKLKKRLVLELLENLVLDFPELSYEIYIKPEYFLYEAMMIRARLFPPMIYSLLNFLRKDGRKKRVESVLNGYLEALKQLENDGVISFSEGYVKISEQFVNSTRTRKIRFINLSRTAPRALFTSLLGIFPQILNAFSQNAEVFLRPQKIADEETPDAVQHLVDPHRYLYVPTASGLVSLAERINIEAFARKVLSAGKDAKVEIKNIGGVLNDVYLIKIISDGVESKTVVKRFRDWSNFKWFPLTLWAVGTRTFAVLGRSRLERECAINKFLLSEGFGVPKVLCVNHSERLIFMEHVEGESLDKVVKRIDGMKTVNEGEKNAGVIARVGEIFARVHALDISLGDTKPENILVSKNGDIYLLDFEQASRNGDKVWDIAEFLYYAGHYISPFSGSRAAELVAKTFIGGYLKAGGNPDVVKKAGNPKYTRVFSVFTFPLTMFVISNVCRKADKLA